MQLYNSQACPCPSDCTRHGKCRECIAFHHARGEQTYCEFLETRQEKAQQVPDGAVKSGREHRLLDYGACAG